MSDLKFFNEREKIIVTRHHLPHWHQSNCVCAITFRLADSLPSVLLRQWEEERAAWMHHHPEPWPAKVEDEYHKRFSDRIQEWLDAGHGSCVLQERGIATIAAGQLRASEKNAGAKIWAFVIMPNHVHVLAGLGSTSDLPRLVRLWKGSSARKINSASGRTGPLWQADYFDRLVRSPHHFERCLDYIRDNPSSARLKAKDCLWWEANEAREKLHEYVAKFGAR